MGQIKTTTKIQPGQIYSANKVIERDLTKKRQYWITECIYCGKRRSVRSDNMHQPCRSCAAKLRPHPFQDDLTGREFGYWKVLGKFSSEYNMWRCECQNCGMIKDVFRGSLMNGESKSCGCVTRSWGEHQIHHLLNEYNFTFDQEHTFEDLITDKGGRPRFDFCVYTDATKKEIFCLIEYQGRQHFKYDKNWRQSEEDFARMQYTDQLKKDYCNESDYTLYLFDKSSNLKLEIQQLATQLNKMIKKEQQDESNTD